MGDQHFQHLAEAVTLNLELEHDWSQLRIHQASTLHNRMRLPRPLLSGLPPRRLYIHPDDQIDMIKDKQTEISPTQLEPTMEWVLPIHLSEKPSIAIFASLFDSLPDSPALLTKPKRLVLATIHDDSTVVYYIMHDGLVKPRQN